MKRRPYLATLGSSFVGGCLSSVPGVGDDATNVTSSELAPPTNWSDQVIAEESFNRSATPIFADGEDRNGRIESNPGGTITDHLFFDDDGTDRYGVRGRIEFDRPGSYIETVRATLDQDDGERVVESQLFVERSRETYLFEIVTTEGSADAVDRYTLEEPEGGTSGPGPTVEDGSTLVEKGWGQLGTADGEPVYGAAITLQNATQVKTGEAGVVVEALLEDETVACNDSASAELEPGETHTFYVPYLRFDPGAVVETAVRHWLLE
ncbi:hypothetical protein [Natronosalvus rutilus]|uniref:Uncharacterized protein n=1 Tax=Natronosalvus rutilus TaxID=2953753 RepID=A0A9E7NCJ2_9EURY|nr:hypothetical protein [Natronosalvus rutilus]UTF54187.1 hypothetical protein NGM29_02570 [Natronosalvus rutilus]